MTPEVLVAGVLFAALVVYSLTGGADFGGGVLDLSARGPRRVDQRRAIALAIGPVWEANHVWLILVIVLTFVAFPDAFATVSIALHVPLTIMLIGIVLRGVALVFRNYDSRRAEVQDNWSRVFEVGSVVSPLMLGMSVGAIASGRIRADAPEEAMWVWLLPFPMAVGGLTLAIFTYLAAVYLTVATWETPLLQEDFRRRGLVASGAVFCLAWLAFFLSESGAPTVWNGLWSARFALPFQVVVAAVGMGTIGALYRRVYGVARFLAAAQVVLVIGGWAVAQYPFVVVPDITVAQAAPDRVLWTLLTLLAIGSPPLVLAYAWMLSIFKAGDAPLDHRQSSR
ncbi:MAG: cytochrome d ubiquinol oxidase subunit II [Rhodobacterales bacterium]|nr:cytochrome d ubiquinol oxidase subunit II [Rhodobacterales bacterium]